MKNLLRCGFLCVFILSCTALFAQAVRKIPADKQRALLWKPDKGQYYFSHSLTFDYHNKPEKTKGTIKVYLDPVTGAMGFRKESSFGNGGKQFDFIIGFPDGRFIYCGNDENGRKVRINEVVKEFKPDPETRSQQKEDFATYCIPTGNKRTDAGLERMEYGLTYATSGTKDTIWLARVPFSVYPLYGMEFLEGAVSLPVTFDYMHLLPADLLITELDAKEVSIKLTGLAHDPTTISTKGYQELKLGD